MQTTLASLLAPSLTHQPAPAQFRKGKRFLFRRTHDSPTHHSLERPAQLERTPFSQLAAAIEFTSGQSQIFSKLERSSRPCPQFPRNCWTFATHGPTILARR